MGHCIEPSEFDLVVIGTGLIESIVAAAAAKSGRSVLQIDPAGHYGGPWASLSLADFSSFISNSSSASGITNANIYHQHAGDATTTKSNQYSIDVASPHLLYGAGPMISLLLGSGAHHYTEYKLVKSTLIHDIASSTSYTVPTTRSEIFRDQTLTPLQKRSLMKCIKAFMDIAAAGVETVETEQASDNDEKQEDGRLTMSLPSPSALPSFQDMLEQHSDIDIHDTRLHDIIMYGVLLHHATSTASLSKTEAIQRFRWYLESLGRYGIDTGPLLTPMYGGGELTQAFCRSSAVQGAIQILRCRVVGAEVGEQHSFTCHGIQVQVQQQGDGTEETLKQTIKTSKLVSMSFDIPAAIDCFMKNKSSTTILRCVAIIDLSSLLSVDEGRQEQGAVLIAFPPRSLAATATTTTTVWGLKLTSSTGVCPRNQCIIHLWTSSDSGNGSDDAEAVLRPCLQSYLQTQYPSSGIDDSPSIVLFSAYYAMHINTAIQATTNVVVCPGPSPDVTLASTVSAAKECYRLLFSSSASDIGSEFPLDMDTVLKKTTKNQGSDDDEKEKEESAAAVDEALNGADSDDEAVQALQAALKLLDD